MALFGMEEVTPVDRLHVTEIPFSPSWRFDWPFSSAPEIHRRFLAHPLRLTQMSWSRRA